jgi:hypothetical protein
VIEPSIPGEPNVELLSGIWSAGEVDRRSPSEEKRPFRFPLTLSQRLVTKSNLPTQLRVFNRLNLVPWVRLYVDQGPAPQGLQDPAQGFNPGNPHNKTVRLEGARDAGTS